jgi:Uma2 family endonuclease
MAHGGGYSATELHGTLTVDGQTRFRLPDVCVVRNDQSEEQRFLVGAPDLIVEIQSPGDPIIGLVRKMDEYFANGARIGWIVAPEEKSVLVLTPDGRPRVVSGDELLEGGEVLPGFALPAVKLFD